MGRHSDHLAGITKKTKNNKIEQSSNLREQFSQFQRVYVVKFSSLKTEYINEIRKRFRNSTLSLLKSSIIKHAIGGSADSEALPGLSELVQYVAGNTGVFMTNESNEDVQTFFRQLVYNDFATAGQTAPATYIVPEGPLPQFTFNMDGHLRELGLPVKLENGVITNVRDYEVCHEGDVLTKKQTQLLKHFGQKYAVLTSTILAYWENGKVYTP